MANPLARLEAGMFIINCLLCTLPLIDSTCARGGPCDCRAEGLKLELPKGVLQASKK